MRFDIIAAVDACYAPVEDDRAWLSGILGALRPLEQGLGCADDVRRFLASEGTGDVLGIFGEEPGRTILLSLNVAGRRYPPRTVHQMTLLAAHVSAAARLRRALRAGARATLRRTDRHEAREIWRGLVTGTWSPVEHDERDGRQYVLVRRNAPGVRDPKALTARDRHVAAFASLGCQNKLIAYALGMSPSAVAAHLRAAQRKLGLPTRAALVRFLAPLVRAPPGATGEDTRSRRSPDPSTPH